MVGPRHMIHRHAALSLALAGLTLATVSVAAPASAQSEDPGGMLRTMPRGTYHCALPGDAGSDAFRVQRGEKFRIVSASRYDSADGPGTYILRGRELVFTSGTRKGDRFDRIGSNQVRKLDTGGVATDLLCTRSGTR